MTTDCTPRYCYADPYEGGKQAIAEAYRNLCAVGARPLAVTNCLNFGNPQRPEIMAQFVECLRGMGDACRALDFPIVSGNVCLYNESKATGGGSAILPTPAIGGVGLLDDWEKIGDDRVQGRGRSASSCIGAVRPAIVGQSLWLEVCHGRSDGPPPPVDLADRAPRWRVRPQLIADGLVTAVHDVSRRRPAGRRRRDGAGRRHRRAHRPDARRRRSRRAQPRSLFGEDSGPLSSSPTATRTPCVIDRGAQVAGIGCSLSIGDRRRLSASLEADRRAPRTVSAEPARRPPRRARRLLPQADGSPSCTPGSLRGIPYLRISSHYRYVGVHDRVHLQPHHRGATSARPRAPGAATPEIAYACLGCEPQCGCCLDHAQEVIDDERVARRAARSTRRPPDRLLRLTIIRRFFRSFPPIFRFPRALARRRAGSRQETGHEGRPQGHRAAQRSAQERADRDQPILAALPDARQLGRPEARRVRARANRSTR